MNKNNKKTKRLFGFYSDYGDDFMGNQMSSLRSEGVTDKYIVDVLPVIKEDIRVDDTLMVHEIKALGKTVRQLVEYLLLLDSEGIIFKSIQEPYFNSDTNKGVRLIKGLRAIQDANKVTISNKSKSIEGSGAKMDSYNEAKDISIVGMWSKTQNVSEISRELGVSRNTVYKSKKRHKLK